MLKPVPAAERGRLRPLFEDFPGLHGVIDSVLEGVLGEARVDDIAQPRIARLELDFHLIGGDPEAPAAAHAVRSVPAGEHFGISERWAGLVMGRREDVQPYKRVSFAQPRRWERARLVELCGRLPDGFGLERITNDNIAAFEQLADSLVYNFASHADFIARGVGFGIRHRGSFVAGCSSFAISSHSLEFEIQTHQDYQRRGLALVTGARMIEHCLDHDLSPCWDAAHEGSARLAERLGFGRRMPYTAYRIE
jgi:GNAT superfamily N-acetyltransferase